MTRSVQDTPFVADFEANLEQRSDRIADRIRETLGCDCSAISVQIDQKLFSLGMAVAPGAQMLPREHDWADTICAKVIQHEGPLCVDDAREDLTLRDLAHVKDVGFAGYLGHPIRDGFGRSYGVLCAVAMDRRSWTPGDKALVEAAASEAGSLFAVQQLRNEITGLHKELADADRILMTLANTVQSLVSVHDATGDMLFASSNLRAAFSETSLVDVVKKALRQDLPDTLQIADLGIAGDDILRLRNLSVSSARGGPSAVSAQIRRAPGDTYTVHWGAEVARLLN